MYFVGLHSTDVQDILKDDKSKFFMRYDVNEIRKSP